MPLFTSARERRLWSWTLVIVTGIYSTLGLVWSLAGALRERGLLGASFLLATMLIGATIVTLGLRTRPGGTEIALALGVAAVYLMVFLRLALPEERTHLIEYGVVALFIHEALTERASQGRRVPVPALLAVVSATLVGVLDECIQWLVPSRSFDPRDMVFNVVAATMAVAARVALGWARQRRAGQRHQDRRIRSDQRPRSTRSRVAAEGGASEAPAAPKR